MIAINDLRFEKIDSPTAPSRVCNMCGKEALMHNGYKAEIEIAADAHHIFFVCSYDCMINFKNHPAANAYINDSIDRSTKIHLNQDK